MAEFLPTGVSARTILTVERCEHVLADMDDGLSVTQAPSENILLDLIVVVRAWHGLDRISEMGYVGKGLPSSLGNRP